MNIYYAIITFFLIYAVIIIVKEPTKKNNNKPKNAGKRNVNKKEMETKQSNMLIVLGKTEIVFIDAATYTATKSTNN